MQASDSLAPYVPRLVVDWLDEAPELRWREVDGSLVFADISGFTELTERLAQVGKVGAEEMTEILDSTFTELLAVAYADGAGLVKWGGDAVLLLFTGGDHTARACRSAVGMQRRMRSLGKPRTSRGLVRLGMSVGVHSATFRFFLVGRLHRELLLAGRDVSTTVAAESAAGAGEVAVSRETAARLDPGLLGAARDGGLLLTAEPDAPPGPQATWLGMPEVDVAPCLPLAIREHVLAAPAAEHRPATIAFVEFTGTDDLLERRGPSAVADMLDETLTSIERAAYEHQVTFLLTDVARDGGKVLLVAGAPTSAGSDEERMLRTLRAILDGPRDLPLRAGVASGRVFAGDFGPPYRRTYNVIGDAVNLAARLMGKAAPGQILATEEVLARSRTRFESERLEAFTVKGKAEQVHAFALGAATGLRTRGPSRAPLVGRERELATLLAALGAARDWEGRVVEIVGEPGLGKSRLVEELEARAGDAEVLRIACEEYEASTPYFPFKSLLRQIFGLVDVGDRLEAGRELRRLMEESTPRLLPWLPLVAIPLDADVPETPATKRLDERQRKARLEEATRELVGLSLARSAVLVFEDVHWMDDASSDLLRELAQGIENRPWLVVITRREETAGFSAPAGATRLDLEPLDAREAAALVERTTEELPLAPHHVSALAERSGGNPLYLVELVSASRAAGGVEALPDSVEGLLTAQIDRLAPSDRSLLRYASVLGASFSADLLAEALAGQIIPPDATVWRRLADFVVPEDGEWRFRHALIRDAAYEGLPYRRRRELHARAGETIERLAERREDVAELLSLHFFHAQKLEEAWRYSRLAGDRAKALYANVEAAAFYERALQAAARLRVLPPPDVAAVSEALGDVRVRLGEFERAGTAYREARRRLGRESAEEAGLLLKQALVPWRLGRYSQALRWISRGLRVLETHGGRDAAGARARFYAWYGVVRQKQGRSLEAIEWCRRAIDEAERAGARDALAHAYYVLDWAYFALGRFDEAVYSPRALAIYEELGNLERQAAVLNNMGVAAHMQGRWDESLELYERARQAWENAGDRWSASYPAANSGEILSDQGRLEDAEPVFRRALRVARASQTPSRVADVSAHLGRLAARAGRFEEARALLAEAREQYVRDRAPSSILAVDARTAECLLLAGRGEEALALAEDGLERAETLEAVAVLRPALRRIRGCALLQLGRLDDARDELVESLRDARDRGVEYEVALALEALATLERLSGGETSQSEAEAREILERLGVVSTPGIPIWNSPAAHALNSPAASARDQPP